LSVASSAESGYEQANDHRVFQFACRFFASFLVGTRKKAVKPLKAATETFFLFLKKSF